MIQHELMPYLPSLMLHFVRASAFFVALSLFGSGNDSKMFRLILAVSIATILWWADDDKLMKDIVDGQTGLEILKDGGFLGLTVMCTIDALVGFGTGFVASLIVQCMAAAGEIISHDMGFAMAQIMDPLTGRSHAVMSQLFQSLIMLLIFALDLHHGFVLVLSNTYDLIPVGHGFNIDPVFTRMNEMVSYTLESAMRYSFPIMGILVLLTAVLVMLARAVPNINLMEFSFGLRIGLSIFAAIFFIGEGVPFLEELATHILMAARNLFVGAT